ncbi:MAG: hypothetical protein JW748_13905 [Anaerolineales bacterium]|nr:hypothetical protein [Anaerolineales bacterium]
MKKAGQTVDTCRTRIGVRRIESTRDDAHTKNIALPWFSAGSYWEFAEYGGLGLIRSGTADMYRIPEYACHFLQCRRDPAVLIPAWVRAACGWFSSISWIPKGRWCGRIQAR